MQAENSKIERLPLEAISVSTAADSYEKLPGTEIGSGRKTTRLNLSLQTEQCASANTAIHIYVENIGSGKWGARKDKILTNLSRWFVPITLADKDGHNHKIFVNVSSLSKRLGVSKEEIARAAQAGKLEELIKAKQQVIWQHEERVVAQYHAIMSQYEAPPPQESPDIHQAGMKKGEFKQETGISPTTLYKVIGLGLAITKTQFLIVDKQKLLATKNGDAVEFFHFTRKVLGRGGYGRVELIYDLAKKEKIVSKIAHQYKLPPEVTSTYNTRREFNKEAKQNLKNEHEILTFLHAEGAQIGIQRAPYQVFEAIGEKGIAEIGYLAPLYDNTLENWPLDKMSTTERFMCAWQLMQGLKTCKNKKVVLGDIKPPNCLLKAHTNPNEVPYECVLSDFGGARRIDPTTILDWGVYTQEYVCNEDKEKFQNFLTQRGKFIPRFYEVEGPNRLSEAELAIKRNRISLIEKQLELILEARDVYALGLTISALLLRAPDLPRNIEDAVSNLVSDMTRVDYRRRIPIEVAFARLSQIIESLPQSQEQEAA